MSLLVLACAGARPGGGPFAESSRDSSPATPDSDSGCASRAYWPDADGDGFGDASVESVEFCEETAGFVTDATDCDDAAAAVNPAAAEDCATGADDDCDGSTDAIDALHCTTWYADEDGDGYGGEAVCACLAPWGDASLTTGGDCDDTDPALNESCTVYVESTYTAALKSAFGLTRLGDVTGDGLGDLGLARYSGGYRALVFGEPPDQWDEPAAEWEDAWLVAPAGDVTGDGADDVWLSTWESGDPGRAWLAAGPVRGSLAEDAAWSTWTGVQENGCLGYLIAAGQDLDGEGGPDAVLVAPWDDGESARSGVAYVAYDLAPGDHTSDEADAAIALALIDSTEVALAADFDGDGVGEVVLAYGHADNGKGAVYLFHTPRGSLSLEDADVTVSDSKGWQAGLGWDAAHGGDLTGDGYADLAAINECSTAFVLAGPLATDVETADAIAVIEGPAWDFGFAEVDGLGDVDGDGFADLAISSGKEYRGGVWIFTGPLAGGLSLDDAAGFHGEYEMDLEGQTLVAGPGDMDGDGLADVALSWDGTVELLLGGFH